MQKNGLQNSGSFVRNQLIFGHNVNTPSVSTGKFPARSSEIVKKTWMPYIMHEKILFKPRTVKRSLEH